MVAVREEYAGAAICDHELLGNILDSACNQIMISVYVGVTGALEAAGDLDVRLAGSAKRLLRVAWPFGRQRFPDIPQQNDAFEVGFEEVEKAQESALFVQEEVTSVSRTKVQIGDDSDVHDGSLNDI
jgi:hypothetical protein